MKSLLKITLLAMVISGTLQAQDYIGNPIVKHIFTADPAVLVYNDSLFIFTGRDEQAPDRNGFFMNEWHVFSTDNMYDYTDHGAVLKFEDFEWASGSAFAGHCTEYNGKFYWFVPMTHKTIKGTGSNSQGFAIGVAVADHPLGPYTPIGEPIITDETPNCIDLNIDPMVYIDNGTPYLFWGSWSAARYVKLKPNMIELDGPVHTIAPRNFFEAPYIHKKDDLYYFTYAGSGYPSKIEYCTSTSIEGPWQYQGVINDLMPVSETNHQAIVEYKGEWYFIYHSSSLPEGGVFRRSVCVDKLEYDKKGMIKKVVRTETSVPKLSND